MFQQKTRSCLMWRIPCLSQVKITTGFRDSLLHVQQLSILVQHDLYALWQTNIAIENGHRNNGSTH